LSEKKFAEQIELKTKITTAFFLKMKI